jgi:outer membrane lipoprotein-sorting protein
MFRQSTGVTNMKFMEYRIKCLILTACMSLVSVGWSTEAEEDSVDSVLAKLQVSAQALTTYECRLEYLYWQPDMFDAKTLRKGRVFYKRVSDKSFLRINFETLKEDEFDEQPYAEHFVFDGCWLTIINYVQKAIQKHEVAEPNQPVNAFELAGGDMPIIGFSPTDDLKKEFDISLAQAEKKDDTLVKLHLKVKPESKYKDNYVSLDFWVSTKRWLPERIDALTKDNDIYQLRFTRAKVNSKITDKQFETKIPEGFSAPEVFPMKRVHTPEESS